MKKIIVSALVVLLAAGLGWAGGVGEKSTAPKVLQLLANSADAVPAFQKVNEMYVKKNPGFTVEVTAIPGVAEFNTAMASKLAAGDVPDLFMYQWGTQIQLYAKGGHVMDLTDSKLMDRLRPVKKPVHVYKGKIFGLPLVQSTWGVFTNWDVCKKYGVTSMPKTFQQWLDAMETMKKNGLEAPLVMPAKDGSGATAWVFGYLHIMVAGKNPDWYKETMEGTKAWNGPEMTQLLGDYAKVLKYANKDMLGLNPDTARQRFAKGEAAYFLNGNWVIANLRELNPKLDFTIETYPLRDREEDMITISDYDNAMSIWSKSKNQKAALAYLDTLFTVEGGDVLSKMTIMLSTVKGAKAVSDDCLNPQLGLLDAGKYVGFSEREWIPGIKEIMKKNVQDWMAGKSARESLDQLEVEHQRLLKAKPEFYKEFMEMRANTTP